MVIWVGLAFGDGMGVESMSGREVGWCGMEWNRDRMQVG